MSEAKCEEFFCDTDTQLRFNDEQTEFEKMCDYHDYTEEEFSLLSANDRRNLWWNYRNVK